MAIEKIVYNGEIWEIQGIACEICGTIMGSLYRHDKGWINPFSYENYGDNKCRQCGQEYYYDEGLAISLTPEQLKLLRKHAGNPKPAVEQR